MFLRQAIASMFALLIFISSMGSFLASVHYMTHKERYAKKLCVSRKDPKSTCEGKCQMKKVAKRQAESNTKKNSGPSIPLFELTTTLQNAYSACLETNWFVISILGDQISNWHESACQYQWRGAAPPPKC